MLRSTQLYGRKFECGTCTAVFYDLHRPNPACPCCSASTGLHQVPPGEPSARARAMTAPQ